MGRTRAGEADDDDRRLDLHVANFWMSFEQIPNPKPGHGIANAIVEMDHAADTGSIGIVVDDREPESQPLAKVDRTEILEPRTFDGGPEYRFH